MSLDLVMASIDPVPYVSAWKAVPLLLVLLVWLRLLTWADKDEVAAHLPRIPLNVGLFSGLLVAVATFFLVPGGWILGYSVVLVVLLIEVGAYLQIRAQKVGLSDLKVEIANGFRGMVPGKKKVVKELVGTVQLVGKGGSLLPAPQDETPEGQAYVGVQKMLTDPLTNNAELVEYTPTAEEGVVRYSVDGVVYNGNTVSRTLGAQAIGYLKAAAGLNIDEARKPQSGTLKVAVAGKRRELLMETKGSTAGEFMRLVSEPKKRHDFTLEKLGLTPDQIAIIREPVLKKEPGIVLLSAPRGQGLTSLTYGVLRAHDAFLEHIITVERDQEQDLEGVTQNKLARHATPEEEAKQITWVVSQQPDVLLVSKPESSEAAAQLIKCAKEGHRIYVTFVAGSSYDTVAAWRKLVGDDKLAMSQLKMVISGRTLRRLCVACKVAYMPDPETLRKLNFDAGKIEKLYQARKEPIRDPKGNPIRCEFCNELRYIGRIGFYEILLVDDDVRAVFAAGGTVSQLRPAFRKQHGQYLQELGLELVEHGDTSIHEVLRVLKAPAGGGSA